MFLFVTALDDLQSSHRKFRLSSCLTTLIPALNWLVHYQVKDDLFKDCIAGITVAVMHIPQGSSKISLMYSLSSFIFSCVLHLV